MMLKIHVMVNCYLPKKVSADQYHVTISLAQVLCSSRSQVLFLKLNTDRLLVFAWIVGPKKVNLLISAGCSEGIIVLLLCYVD